MSGRRIRVFISYAHADRKVVDQLRSYIGWLEHDERISVFDDSQLVGGEKWDRRLKDELANADIVLLVVTAAFASSRYCTRVELKEALRRCEGEGIRVIPILAATCDWEAMPITDLQALPKDQDLRLKPLNKWGRNIDVALTQIAKHVRKNVDDLSARAARDPSDLGWDQGRDVHRGWRLPEPPDRCLGREDDLAVLVAALTAEEPRPVIVFGEHLDVRGSVASERAHVLR